MCYRDMKPDQRSFRRTAEMIGVPLSAITSLASRYDWNGRMKAYVDYLSKRRTEIRLHSIEMLEQEELRLGRKMMQVSLKGARNLDTVDVTLAPTDVVALGKTGSDLRRRSLALPKDKPEVQVNTQVNVQTNVIAGLVAKLDRSKEEFDKGGLLEA